MPRNILKLACGIWRGRLIKFQVFFFCDLSIDAGNFRYWPKLEISPADKRSSIGEFKKKSKFFSTRVLKLPSNVLCCLGVTIQSLFVCLEPPKVFEHLDLKRFA